MSSTSLILVAVLAQAAAPIAQPPALIQEVDARFVRDLHDKKIDDVLTLYADEAVFVNPDGTEVRADGLRKLYETVTSTFDSDLHLQVASFIGTGSSAEETGTFAETLRHRDNGQVENTSGSFRFLLRSDPAGHWLYTRMEWHSQPSGKASPR